MPNASNMNAFGDDDDDVNGYVAPQAFECVPSLEGHAKPGRETLDLENSGICDALTGVFICLFVLCLAFMLTL